jgi:hypothetical protein
MNLTVNWVEHAIPKIDPTMPLLWAIPRHARLTRRWLGNQAATDNQHPVRRRSGGC